MDKKIAAFDRLLGIMDELREKCPWDRKQTFESLINNTVEETFELVDALMDKDMENVKKELGDLLLQVVFYAKIGEEQGVFDIGDVATAISDKLVYRHPHVFGEVNVDNADEVLVNWEALKKRERAGKGGVLSGVPRSLPPLVKAFRIQEKAAAVGFDWESKEQVWAKVKEELGEFEEEMSAVPVGTPYTTFASPKTATVPTTSAVPANLEEEFGDLLFALVNAGRLYGISPAAALEKCNQKFTRRFNYIETEAKVQSKELSTMTLAEMDALWNEAKKQERPKDCSPI